MLYHIIKILTVNKINIKKLEKKSNLKDINILFIFLKKKTPSLKEKKETIKKKKNNLNKLKEKLFLIKKKKQIKQKKNKKKNIFKTFILCF